VSQGPALPDPSKPYRQPTLKQPLRVVCVSGLAACRASGLLPFSTHWTPHMGLCRTPLRICTIDLFTTRAVWEGVSMDSLKFHSGLPCPNLLCPAGGPPSKRPYGCFWGDPPTEWAVCGHLLSPWIPHAVRACLLPRDCRHLIIIT
jgi:hypothetical protein